MNFDIDLVYLWVDGEDPVWIKKLIDAKNEKLSEEAISKCRFQNSNELMYSIRSVKKFAPWIRNIFIVTDNQTPEWFKAGKGIKIINQKDILPSDCNICFNSCAIETCLHKIPELSEYFLYANDDMNTFLLRKANLFTDSAKEYSTKSINICTVTLYTGLTN